MAETLVKPYNMSIANRLMGPLAQTNHFLVTLSSLTPEVEDYLQRFSNAPDVRRFITERSGILCSDASLPTTTYATAEVRDNFMGVPQQYAHTRIYTDIDFSFYIVNTVQRKLNFPYSFKIFSINYSFLRFADNCKSTPASIFTLPDLDVIFIPPKPALGASNPM